MKNYNLISMALLCALSITLFQSCIDIPIKGCTCSQSSNYDPEADEDDGSCIGCTQSGADNFNSCAAVDNGSCFTTVLGCTNPNSTNYDPDANKDDGSCIAVVRGCTDPNAFNYDPDANTDDGSCIAVVEGCTDPTASNYDSNANTDDGSCSFSTATELPTGFLGNWYNTSGTWIYGISEDATGDYIRTNNIFYYYSGTDVDALGDGVYKVTGTSSAGAEKIFYLRQGSTTNELQVSGSATSGYTSYYKDWSAVGVELPSDYIGKWYNIAGTWIYGIDKDGTGDYIRTNNVFYYYTDSNVTESSGIYTVEATSSGGTARTFYLKQDDDKNKVSISQSSSASGYSDYWKVTGRTVARVTHEGGSFELSSGTAWVEKNAEGTVTFNFTENSRDDWSVYLDDDDGRGRLQIDIYLKTTFWTPTGGTRGELYKLTGWYNE